MLVVEVLEVAACLIQAGVLEGARGVSVDVGTRVQAKSPEQPLLVSGEVAVGQVERRGHRQVLGLHQSQPVPGGSQVSGQARGGPGRVTVQLAGQHSDRQRQVPAQPGNLTHPSGSWAQARPAGQAY